MSNKESIELRENVIGYIYSHELLNTPLNGDAAFESGEYSAKEIKYIEQIGRNYEIFKKLIVKFCTGSWNWSRMSVLSKSILIYGAFELSFNDKALVIDVLIKYAKEFAPDDSYKFINSILDKVGKYYESVKASKK